MQHGSSTSALKERRKELEGLVRKHGLDRDERFKSVDGDDAVFAAAYATALGLNLRQALDETTPLGKLEYGRFRNHSDDSDQ